MKLVGAIVKWEGPNGQNTVEFSEIHPFVSLKDKPCVMEYAGSRMVIDPGVWAWAPEQCIRYMTEDRTSPFFRDKALFVARDDKIGDAAKLREEYDAKNKAVEAENALPDGLPNDKDGKWRPKHFAMLYSLLEPKTIKQNIFQALPPAGKCRLLREYMEKNDISVKSGAIVREVGAP